MVVIMVVVVILWSCEWDKICTYVYTISLSETKHDMELLRGAFRREYICIR